MNRNQDYAELAGRAERGELRPVPGTAVRGQEAAELGQQWLMEATGTDSAADAVRVALGRPRLDTPRSDLATWKVKTPRTLDEKVRSAAHRRGVTVSEWIREAASHQLDSEAALAR
ncbi:MAG: hypothetical protein LBN10_00120 [Propionibacteriaceae bacterium]|jgi:hypothetical protein|nr:hypothetical protein [Propionibacteriaceae bacterium]